MSVQLPIKQNMLFKTCEIRGTTCALTPLNGARGTVTNITKDDCGLSRYVVRFDSQQPSAWLTQAVADVTSPQGQYIVPCGLVCEPPPDSRQCLVYTKSSRFKYHDLNDTEASVLHYCSPDCRTDHKHRHKKERAHRHR